MNAIQNIQIAQPGFYNANQQIVNKRLANKGCLTLKGVAVDIENNQLMNDVTFKFIKYDAASMPVIIESTDFQGCFFIQSFAEGIYYVYVSKPGYTEQIVVLSVAEGQNKELVIKMEKCVS